MQAAPRQPQQSAPTVSYTTQSSAPGQQSYQKVALDANGIVRQVMASPMVPADFKTQEWGIIIGAIHRQEDPALIQDQIDQQLAASFVEVANGEAEIETYAVLHGKSGPETGVLFGRLRATGERFLANTPTDADTLSQLESTEGIGLAGMVSQVDGRNVFIPRFS
jgi:hypothetical protein